MSIKVMNRVWEYSKARGGELLVLLAIADHANDEGLAWPGIDSLAKKSRLAARHVTRCIKNLAAAGELLIQHNRGPKGTNYYRVLCFRSPDNVAALSAKCQDDRPCRGDRCLPQMSPESSESSEPSAQIVDVNVVAEQSIEWPEEAEVLRYARTYPGNIDIGIPANAITEDWASDYWAWRTFDEERWPNQWKKEMFRRFEREWRDGGKAARGRKKNTARGAIGCQPDGPPAPVKSRPVSLIEMRAAVE